MRMRDETGKRYRLFEIAVKWKVDILHQQLIYCLGVCILLFPLLCSSNQAEKNSQKEKMSKEMNTLCNDKKKAVQMDYFPELVLSIPWGDGVDAIPASPIPLMHATGAFLPSSKRYIRPLYGIRIDSQGHIYILFPIPQEADPDNRKYRLLSFNHDGNIISQFEFSVDKRRVSIWNILDFSPDHEGGIIVLELLQAQNGDLTTRLRKFDYKGKRKWERKGRFSSDKVNIKKLEGNFNRICFPNENLFYLPANFPQRGMARLNPSNGKIIKAIEWDEYPERVTIGPDNKAYYAKFIESAGDNKIVLVRYDIETGKKVVIESDIQNLHNLAAIDTSGAVYPRIHDGIARLSAEGKLVWKESVYGVVIRETDKHIFVCNRAEFEQEKLVFSVNEYDTDGKHVQTYTFEINRQEFDIGNALPRFIHVDSDMQFYFHGGESVEDAGIMISFTRDGKLKERVALSENTDDDTLFDNLNNRVLPIEARSDVNTFEVDISGRACIPVSDPSGFKVVCFRGGRIGHDNSLILKEK